MEDDRQPGDPVQAAQLKALREDAGLSPDQLARLIGVTRPTIVRIENATRSPSTSVLNSWYRACGFVVGGVKVGGPQDTASLGAALAGLRDQDELHAVIEVIRAWPGLSERDRGRILEIAHPK